MYANYKYTDRGGRLAVFATPVEETDDSGVTYKTMLFILRCSRRDIFSKNRAKEVFTNWKETGRAYYTEVKKDVLRDTAGVAILFGGGVPEFTTTLTQKEAHPVIDLLRFECNPINIEKYLSTLYDKPLGFGGTYFQKRYGKLKLNKGK